MQRRNFLKASAAAAALLTVPKAVQANSDVKIAPNLTFALLTDVHIEPGIVPETGFANALKAIQKQKPAFIVNGGDSIFDSLDRTEENIAAQWQTWHKLMQKENILPILNCIGNHDVYGWDNKDPNVKSRADYGKTRVLTELKMKAPYYHQKKENWHFIVLDSIHPHPKGFEAKLDEEQFNWLKQTLASIPKSEFVILISHVPLFSAAYKYPFEDKKNELFTDLSNRIMLHTDSWKIKEVLKNYSNVKLCLSGHLHLQEELKYLNTTYINCGAISGNWWKGVFQEFAPAFFMFNLYKNGNFNYKVINY